MLDQGKAMINGIYRKFPCLYFVSEEKKALRVDAMTGLERS